MPKLQRQFEPMLDFETELGNLITKHAQTTRPADLLEVLDLFTHNVSEFEVRQEKRAAELPQPPPLLFDPS